jgi:hypothetical protein
LVHEDDTFFGCEVDHIISEKYGRASSADNLAYACAFCNRNKGTDIGSLIHSTGAFCRFFNPRTDRWTEHFAMQGARLRPLTDMGAVTERILGFNAMERVLERRTLIAAERYPSPAALARMTM